MFPNLKFSIWKAGLRQNRLARILGIDETVLSRIVNGSREASPELQQRIADVLQSDREWLFERVPTAAVSTHHAPGNP
ncbi:MAG: helix-turn-helix transcriptional regulator [Bryobacterales bacterium]|nr:helix-turn-helix transcriptional regulator [Bryobacterales bacterium]